MSKKGGRNKKQKVELLDEPPPALYQVFAVADLRNMLFSMCPPITWIAFWFAFPKLFQVFKLSLYLWPKFEDQILSQFGITTTDWMSRVESCFTGSTVLEFLLDEWFERKDYKRDLDLLLSDPGFDVKHMLFHHCEGLSHRMGNDQTDALIMLSRLGMVVTKKTSKDEYCEIDNGVKYPRGQHETWSAKIDLLYVKKPETNEFLYLDVLRNII